MSKRNFAAWTMTIDGRPAHAEALSEVVNPSTGEGFAASPLCSNGAGRRGGGGGRPRLPELERHAAR